MWPIGHILNKKRLISLFDTNYYYFLLYLNSSKYECHILKFLFIIGLLNEHIYYYIHSFCY